MKYLVSLIVLILLSFLLFNYLSSPVSNLDLTKNFVINQGEGLISISSRLQDNGLIRNRYFFYLMAYQKGMASKIQSGLFKLAPSLTTAEIIDRLSSAGRDDYWLKIIEGQRLSELEVKFDPAKEGYIFPDSYLIPNNYSVAQIETIINSNFAKKVAEAKVDSTHNRDLNDIIILASIIEREARSLETKQMVSGILLNRLNIGMALQVDATIQYARDTRLKPKQYWTPITKSDISINSPYNTYKNPGLPPGPICNPGFNSIYAAYHPIKSDYLYYITGNDNQMHYAKTLTEHNANIAKYLK